MSWQNLILYWQPSHGALDASNMLAFSCEGFWMSIECLFLTPCFLNSDDAILFHLVMHYVSYVCMLFLASWLVHPVRKTSYRSYSCSVSLCDPSGYEGGVIQFFRGFGIKDRWHMWMLRDSRRQGFCYI